MEYFVSVKAAGPGSSKASETEFLRRGEPAVVAKTYQFDFASNRYRVNGGSDPLAQINEAVSEPATMLLLGLGLIGLAGYGRVKLNK